MSTPSERDRREADSIAIQYFAKFNPMFAKCSDSIARALAARSAVPDGHVRLPDGREVKVLGTLPKLADGTLYGGIDDDYNIERVWCVRPFDRKVVEMEPQAFWSELGDWRVVSVEPIDAEGNRVTHPLSWCYSTQEAAEAAARGGER